MTALALHSDLKGKLGDWLALTKCQISAASTLTAAMGYIAASHSVDRGLLPTIAGTMLLAMASSVLNEIEERDIDAQMQRTRHRPLPSGQIGVGVAMLAAFLLAGFGVTLLYSVRGTVPAFLGLLAMFWYNGLYTPLKRYTAFAVVPGSVIGALPPAIGWTAAGGDIESPAVLAMGFVLFLWQVPHFWLLAMRYQADYARGGLPTLSRHFSDPQIYRLVFMWTAASVVSCSLLWTFQVITGKVAAISLILGGVWLLLRFLFMLAPAQSETRGRRAFFDINRFALVLMGAVVFDALVGM